MSEYAEVRPVEGRLVFVPENGRPLSPEGERVELTPFWRRRLMDGDVAEIPAAPAQHKPVSAAEGQSAEPPAEAHEESSEVSDEDADSPEETPEAEEPAEDEEES